MKAVRIHRFGSSDELQVEEVPTPAYKDTEVLVRILDVGVNPLDWKVRQGLMRDVMPVQFPLTLGQDFAGEVLEVGSAVLEFKVGDSVFGFAQGAYAEEAAIDVDQIALMPHSIDFATAATIPTAGLTAWQAVIDEAKVAYGQRVLVIGAAGGVGTFAVQLAKWMGASVIAVASSEDADYLHGLGVELVIARETDDFTQLIENIDVVIDLVGGESLRRASIVLKPGGKIVTTVGPAMKGVVQLLMKPDARQLHELARLVERGALRPKIARVLHLDEAKAAQDLSQFGHKQGKIVIEIL